MARLYSVPCVAFSFREVCVGGFALALPVGVCVLCESMHTFACKKKHRNQGQRSPASGGRQSHSPDIDGCSDGNVIKVQQSTKAKCARPDAESGHHVTPCLCALHQVYRSRSRAAAPYVRDRALCTGQPPDASHTQPSVTSMITQVDVALSSIQRPSYDAGTNPLHSLKARNHTCVQTPPQLPALAQYITLKLA
jgi:hypothetical protein